MKRLITGLILVILVVGTVACAKAPSPAPTTTSVYSGIPAPAPQEESIFGLGGSKSGSSPVVITQVPAPTITIPPAPAPRPTPAPTTVVPYATDSDQSWTDVRMIIRNGNIALVVDDVTSAVEQITRLAASYNGYVVSSNTWKDGDRLMGNIAIRVPVESFDASMGALRGMAVEVNSESTSGQDVTEEYIDLSAKLHNLEAAEAQLLRLMEEKTEKVTDILEVQRELVKTRGEIEQTKGRMQYLEKSSAMSLISVNLQQAALDVRFKASNNVVKTGQSIRFDPTIAGGFSPYSYEWNFGDGGTSTDSAPTHVYKSDGSYTVKLKVTDDHGKTDEYNRDNYITVLPGWNAGNVASSAWNGFLAFGRVVINIIIWLAIFIPLWIVVGVILYYAWWRRRKKA